MATTQEQQNQILDFYLNHNNPNTDPKAFYDTDQQAAEQASAAGGQTFSGARGGLLRRSQVMQNLAAATPILAQRQSTIDDLAKLAQAGEQAKEQERLHAQLGLAAQTQAEAAVTRETILKGQQAILQLQTDQQGKVILAQMGINANQEQDQRRFANDNYQLQQKIAADASQNASNQNFTAGQNTLNRSSNFNIAGLNANAHLQGTRIANGTFDNNATKSVIDQIIQSTSGAGGGRTVTGNGGAAIPGAGIVPSNDYGNEMGMGTDVAQATQPSYYFGTDSPNTNPAGNQSYGGNAPITNEDFYYLTGGESG